MRCLGIAIKKNEVWFSAVDGTEMENAVIYDTGKQMFRAESQTLMTDFYNIFVELITKYKPTKICYKLSLEIQMKQISYLHFSLGVLNLLCLQNNIESIERSNRWITAGKRKKIGEFQEYFNNVSFKNEQLEATLVAWYGLGE